MVDIVERLRFYANRLDDMRGLNAPSGNICREAAAEILALRQQVEKARAQGRDEGLEEAREANRKLHRRAQIAEGMKDSFYGIVEGWARVLRGSERKSPGKICWASYKLGQMSGVALVYYDLDKRCKRALKSGEGV